MDSPQPFRPNLGLALLGFTILFGLALFGVRTLQKNQTSDAAILAPASGGGPAMVETIPAAAAPLAESSSFATRTSSGPLQTPTPDNPHPLPAPRTRARPKVAAYRAPSAPMAV